MGLAVQAFYLNGGKAAYICRIAGSGALAASISVNGQDTSPPNQDVLKISASSVGSWGEEVYIRLEKPKPTALNFKLEVGHIKNGGFIADEVFDKLTMNEKDTNYAITVVNRDSALVRLSLNDAVVNANIQNGRLIGEAVATDANYFSNGITSNMTMRINIDGLGVKTINLGKVGVGDGDLDLTGNFKTGGENIAARIQLRIQQIDNLIEGYSKFECTFDDSTKKFTLTSGTTSSYSSVSVYSGELASLLKLDPASNPTLVHGSAKIIPVQTLGGLYGAEQLTGGSDAIPYEQDYTEFLNGKLKKVRDVSVLVLPGASYSTDTGNAIIDTVLSHCEAMRNRVLIIDLPEGKELTNEQAISGLTLPTSTYSVMYYPWIQISNPFYHEDTNPTASKTLTIAPSAFAAGMWAKIDGKRGVWKAPAGVETQLLGAAGLEYIVEEGEQDFLNPAGINAIRKLPSFGSVIWGSRTLATKADPEWRYVPVRRTAIFIEQSIYNGIQWAVFEPNDHPLWGALRANIGSFMNGLFRASAFQGKTANEAYFVRCGLGDTMTQGDIDSGQVIVIVGFAPLKPAEFVIVRIQQKVAQQ